MKPLLLAIVIAILTTGCAVRFSAEVKNPWQQTQPQPSQHK